MTVKVKPLVWDARKVAPGVLSVPQPLKFARLPDEIWKIAGPYFRAEDCKFVITFRCEDGRRFDVEV